MMLTIIVCTFGPLVRNLQVGQPFRLFKDRRSTWLQIRKELSGVC